MIYYVSNNQMLFEEEDIVQIPLQKALGMLDSWKRIQFDTETTGRDAHINDFLCIQFGNRKEDAYVVVDTSTVNISVFKNILESKLIIGQNIKFDLQFLYNYNIHPLKVYDTMIVEQLLYLGYPKGKISYSLKAIAERRLNIDIDKSVRGEIIWRGLDINVLKYAAGDVTYLEDILESQVIDLNKQGLIKAAILENDAIPAIAYMEWCGIKLDEDRWREKMDEDQKQLHESLDKLNEFVVNTPSLQEYVYIDRQGSLFDGFDLTPRVNINWSSSQQVVKVANILGFNTKIQDKKTGEDKESVLEKHLKGQKGINDEFLKLYFKYQEYDKVCSSFGQGHLNAVNPITGRIHTIYKQLGAASGRMSCGSKQSNYDLAKYKKLKPSEVSYPNIQQLPANEETRSSFISEENNLFCSADYSA